MNIIIIPARGGSKRIPRKNIKEFKGKPIIERTINSVKDLNCFNKIVVSTDDNEIASISMASGAEVPFRRPKNLAGDFISTREVILHAIQWLESKDLKLDYVCCLYPTCPLLESKYLVESLKLLSKCKSNVYVFSAGVYSHPIQRAFYIDENEMSKMFFPENNLKRTQDLDTAYYDLGQFYIASSQTWKNKKNIFEGSKPFIIPRWEAIDIDTNDDWKMAELIYELNIKEKGS